MPYVKLDCGITRSTIWMEDAETVRVWIYLLAEADSGGNVFVTVPAIARDNLIGVDHAREILAKFSGPDQDSKDPGNEGRRIVIHREPEWRVEILNYLKYREKDYTNKDRQKAYRQRHRDRNGVTSVTALQNVTDNGVTPVTKPLRVTQAEAEVLKDKHLAIKKPDGRFNLFWNGYPRKAKKVDAEKAFRKLNPDEDLLATILASIAAFKVTDDWTKDGGKYIPYPASWLNGKRWEDELPGTQTGLPPIENPI